MGSNGLTSARHDVFSKYLAEKYPESYDKAVPEELVYSGGLKLTDAVEDSPLDAGKLVLSPTRTYAPVVKKLLDALRPEIHGMVHCSGGAQTKVLHFIGDNCRVIKDNLFLLCSKQLKSRAIRTGQRCTRYSIWDTALKYICRPNMPRKLLPLARASASMHRLLDVLKKATRKN